MIFARRFLAFILIALACTGTARADDISAAGRGVVRIVTIALVDDEVVGFGHGSGFAIAPNRIVTNAHVVEAAARYPGNVLIGVVPSEGSKSYQGKLIAYDADRDLALIEFSGVKLPPLTLWTGSPEDGESVIALGYPGNVDLATARSAADFITPLSPVRSQGVFSGRRQLGPVEVLLHTANIARGNSGGPLLDPCGRVVGVNSAITRSDEGDASFGFAIADNELAAFLNAAKQPFAKVGIPCTSMEESMAIDRDAEEAAATDAAERTRAAEAKAAADRQAEIARATAENQNKRENYMAVAALLLVLGALTLGTGGVLETRGDRRAAIAAGVGGVALIGAAVTVFLVRPSFDADSFNAAKVAPSGSAALTTATGPMQCTLVPKRSRITVTETPKVTLDVGKDGCMNGRTQYAEKGKRWQRILVPDQEQTVSVIDYDPLTQIYTNSRYLLTGPQMTIARNLRQQVKLKACSADPSLRADLASRQDAIRTALPQYPNERLVYRCKPGKETAAPAAK